MDNFEKVEKLKERANVTYEEAKQALEACDWDILEAMIYLEKL
ncbi:MAG: UBA/TS-N domain protein, partial [Agathobacter sp.]|nr:UBA/TS-N domain protein [Agathobacter sp.]